MTFPEDLETVTRCGLCGSTASRPWRQAACVESPAEVFPLVECAGCGVRYVAVRPRPEAMERYYPTGYYSYQFASLRSRRHHLGCRIGRALGLLPPRGGAWPRLVQATVARVWGPRVRWLLPAPRPGARFLDIGCGAGQRLELARDLGWDTYGVDLGQTGLPAARAQGFRVAAADAAALPFAADSFDYVNLAHTLEHTREPLAVLEECSRVLTDRGAAQIVVPNSDSEGSQRYGSHWRALDVPRHLFHFTADSLCAAAVRAGLAVIGVRTFADDWVLQESAKLAEAALPRASRMSRWQANRRLQGETLEVWCRRR